MHNIKKFYEPEQPEFFEDAIKSEQKNKWFKAMKTQKHRCLNETENWHLAPRGKGKNFIPGWCPYKTEHHSNANINK